MIDFTTNATKRGLFVIFAILLIFISSFTIYANEPLNTGESYEVMVVSEEEHQALISYYSNPNFRNTLPNLVLISFSRDYSYTDCTITNIAVDSLDYVTGDVIIYNDYGRQVGKGIINKTNLGPMKSWTGRTTVQIGDTWSGGISNISASDGSVSNSGVFYFSR